MSKYRDSSKNITGLSFRDIRLAKKGIERNDILFLDEDIAENPVVFRVRKLLFRLYEKLEGNQGIGGFLLDFFRYLSSRVRVLLVILSVISDMLLGNLEKRKDSLSKSFSGVEEIFLNLLCSLFPLSWY